jgi:hypothetical protein
MVRLYKHTLPKRSNKVAKSAKHKDSPKSIEKKLKKQMKESNMDVDENIITENNEKTPEQKEEERLQRKKQNAHRTLYKKNIQHMTDRRGPRAVSG